MNMCYAGVGSRETPEAMLVYFRHLAGVLETSGYTLRSGGAPGADSAFEQGVFKLKEIFLPWKGFNGNASPLYRLPELAFTLAEKFHPAWPKLKPAVRCLMARNVLQVLGPNCDSPSAFVVCWTKDASGAGGTGQAIRIARAYRIPVFDFGDPVRAHGELTTFLSRARGFA